MSSFSSCMFGFVGVGAYFKPFSYNFISFSFNFLEDKLTIWMSAFEVTCSGVVGCPGTKNHLTVYLFHFSVDFEIHYSEYFASC